MLATSLNTKRGFTLDRVPTMKYWISGDYNCTDAGSAKCSAVRQRIIRTGQAGAPSQGTDAARPTIVANVQNGRQVLRGTTGVRMSVSITLAAATTIFFVVTPSSVAAKYYCSDASNLCGLTYGFTAGKWKWIGSNASDFPVINSGAVSGFHIIMITQTDGATNGLNTYLDNVLATTQTPVGNLSGAVIDTLFDDHGSGASVPADIADMGVLYEDLSLNSPRRNEVYGFLKRKWGL